MIEQSTEQIILSLEGISLHFGGVRALQNVSLQVRQQSIHSIIGPNGAGKSSLLNVINGFYRPQRGRIRFKDHVCRSMKPHRAASLGMGRTFQNIALFRSMSALDNIMIGRNLMMRASSIEQMLRLPRARREEWEHRRKVEEIIDFLRIERIRRTEVGRLPYGLQKRVDLARALASEPELLLLDEPMAGMNTEEKEDICRFILDIQEEFQTTIILIEHDMGVVMDLSDRITVLDHGVKLAEGTPAEIGSNQDVIDAYLGVVHAKESHTHTSPDTGVDS